ncbi:aldolase/citrate lyase family protein [Phytohabitans suffuscus]|uniref:aldolase/citrate lyase family protein n=1 Tax=Phytohabitans suffuscus TaxID=624315 RepID=UPI001567504E|nr:aldolase/citrate lyase family protein [Phytohabitans suffuscus]
MLPLTWLYVPGDRPDRFAKALASGADAVILDLEDAVAAPRKAYARSAVAEFVAEPRDPRCTSGSPRHPTYPRSAARQGCAYPRSRRPSRYGRSPTSPRPSCIR